MTKKARLAKLTGGQSGQNVRNAKKATVAKKDQTG